MIGEGDSFSHTTHRQFQRWIAQEEHPLHLRVRERTTKAGPVPAFSCRLGGKVDRMKQRRSMGL